MEKKAMHFKKGKEGLEGERSIEENNVITI